MYRYLNHAQSGETFAVESNDSGTITSIIGPLHHEEIGHDVEEQAKEVRQL